MRKFSLLILSLFLAGLIHAQTTQISGQVADTSEKKPLANAHLGMQVVKILEASQESIKNKGKEVKIK